MRPGLHVRLIRLDHTAGDKPITIMRYHRVGIRRVERARPHRHEAAAMQTLAARPGLRSKSRASPAFCRRKCPRRHPEAPHCRPRKQRPTHRAACRITSRSAAKPLPARESIQHDPRPAQLDPCTRYASLGRAARSLGPRSAIRSRAVRVFLIFLRRVRPVPRGTRRAICPWLHCQYSSEEDRPRRKVLSCINMRHRLRLASRPRHP